MKILKLVPNKIDSKKEIEVSYIIKDCCGFIKQEEFTIPLQGFIVEMPLSGTKELPSCATLWVGIKLDENNYSSVFTDNKEELITKVVNFDFISPALDVQTAYTLEELIKNNKQPIYKLNIDNRYDIWKELEIDTIEVTTDEDKVNFSEMVDELEKINKPGEYTYQVAFTLKNGFTQIEKFTITIPERKEVAVPKLKPITFNYAFFTPLHKDVFKPNCPVICYLSDNIKLNKVDFEVDGQLVKTFTDISNVLEISLGKAVSFSLNTIKATFHGTDKQTNEPVVIEDSKKVVVSEAMDITLYHNFNSDKGVFNVGISATDAEVKNITKILWQITYDSIVMENILSAGETSVKMYSDVVFETTSDNSKLEYAFDFKKNGEYFIKAYVYDTAGQIHVIKDSLKTLTNEGNNNNYQVNSKIPVIIKSNNGKSPTFKLSYIKNNTFNENGVVITDKLFDNIYSAEFKVEYNDCVYIVEIGENMKTFYVGDSDNIVVLKIKPNAPLPKYVFKDYDGKEISSGTISTNKDKTIGFVQLDKDKSGLLKIGDSIYKKIN